MLWQTCCLQWLFLCLLLEVSEVSGEPKWKKLDKPKVFGQLGSANTGRKHHPQGIISFDNATFDLVVGGSRDVFVKFSMANAPIKAEYQQHFRMLPYELEVQNSSIILAEVTIIHTTMRNADLAAKLNLCPAAAKKDSAVFKEKKKDTKRYTSFSEDEKALGDEDSMKQAEEDMKHFQSIKDSMDPEVQQKKAQEDRQRLKGTIDEKMPRFVLFKAGDKKGRIMPASKAAEMPMDEKREFVDYLRFLGLKEKPCNWVTGEYCIFGNDVHLGKKEADAERLLQSLGGEPPEVIEKDLIRMKDERSKMLAMSTVQINKQISQTEVMLQEVRKIKAQEEEQGIYDTNQAAFRRRRATQDFEWELAEQELAQREWEEMTKNDQKSDEENA